MYLTIVCMWVCRCVEVGGQFVEVGPLLLPSTSNCQVCSKPIPAELSSNVSWLKTSTSFLTPYPRNVPSMSLSPRPLEICSYFCLLATVSLLQRGRVYFCKVRVWPHHPAPSYLWPHSDLPAHPVFRSTHLVYLSFFFFSYIFHERQSPGAKELTSTVATAIIIFNDFLWKGSENERHLT